MFFLLCGVPLSLYAYMGGFADPFRSDEYTIYNLFNVFSFSLSNLVEAAIVRPFAEVRLCFLNGLVHLFQIKVLGTNDLLQHTFLYSLHLLNSVLLYLFIRDLHGDDFIAFIGSLLFLTFYSHFDTVNWGMTSNVLLSPTFILLTLIAILRYLRTADIQYIAAAVTLSFIPILLYENNIIFPITSLLFFVLAHSYCRNEASSLASLKTYINKGEVKLFASGIFIIYALCLYIFLASQPSHEGLPGGGQTDTGKVTYSQILSKDNFYGATLTTSRFLLDPLILKNFGFPSDIFIADIVYLRPATFGMNLQSILALSCVIIILAFIRLRKGHLPLLFLFTAVLISNIFILSLVRQLTAPEGYVLNQSRYAYIPNLFLVIILSFLVKEKARNGYKHLLSASILVVVLLNCVHTHNHVATISEKLSELSNHIKTVKNFCSSLKEEKNPEIFVNFPVIQKNRTFNLGADIALDVYFPRVITKNVRAAQYIYDETEGIHSNPLHGKTPKNPDFTMEFVYMQSTPYIIQETALLGKKEGAWWLEMSPDGLMRFRTGPSGLADANPYCNPGIKVPFGRWHHIALQRQNGKFYILLDGEIMYLSDVTGHPLYVDKSSHYFMGDFYLSRARGAIFSSQLFVSIGRAKYDLEGRAMGERIHTSWLSPPWDVSGLREPAWVVIDLGVDNERVINSIKAMPRPGYPSHFWRRAELEGSKDGTLFTKISDVNQEDMPPDGEYMVWSFDNETRYRYYRLLIYSGHAEDGRFYSFSELELIDSNNEKMPTLNLKYTSSPHLKNRGPDRLADADAGTFWHVR
ncbi:MAG: hypothetical protein Q6359_07565 [Candidatus Brocadiales bacterium]|nr:hypothetical protein [Candidatus Brocadiales bacterium]